MAGSQSFGRGRCPQAGKGWGFAGCVAWQLERESPRCRPGLGARLTLHFLLASSGASDRYRNNEAKGVRETRVSRA